MLVALSFRPVAEVRKTRRVLHIQWQSQEIEISLDHIASLGDFLELELTADEKTLDAAKAAIASFAAALGLTASERRSYLELLLAKS
jgi:predicted adenylyl cyclase CyaB